MMTNESFLFSTWRLRLDVQYTSGLGVTGNMADLGLTEASIEVGWGE